MRVDRDDVLGEVLRVAVEAGCDGVSLHDLRRRLCDAGWFRRHALHPGQLLTVVRLLARQRRVKLRGGLDSGEQFRVYARDGMHVCAVCGGTGVRIGAAEGLA